MSTFFRILAVVCLLHVFSEPLLAQHKEWSNWLGGYGYLTFRNGYPEYKQDNYSGSPYSYNGGGGVAYSDSTTGDIKFIVANNSVYGADYDTVTNGYNKLYLCDGSLIVVPFPSGENKFYIFHSFIITYYMGLQTRCQVYGNILHIDNSTTFYSILDMDANNGKGAILSNNNYLYPSYDYVMQPVRHSNGRDVWLILHTNGSIISFLINADGIQLSSPVLSPVPGGQIRGMDVSPDGKKMAFSFSNSKTAYIYKFDNSTGMLSYFNTISTPDEIQNLCFSPDGSKLYLTTHGYVACTDRSTLYQADLEPQGGGSQGLYFVGPCSTGYLQRAFDHKIYVSAGSVYYTNSRNTQMWDVLNYPNQPQTACSYVRNYFEDIAYSSYPRVINDYVKDPAEPAAVNLNLPKKITACLGDYTIAAPTGYEAYKWNTGETTREIKVSRPGNYNVLAGKSGFIKPDAYGFTEVVPSSEFLDLGNDAYACIYDGYTLSISPYFSSVLWNDGDTAHVKSIKQKSGKYSVEAVDSKGCKAWDSVCIGLTTPPKVKFGNDTILCVGATLKLVPDSIDIIFNNYTYLWSTGAATATIKVTQPGIYWCKATGNSGCTASDTIIVKYNNSPRNIYLGNDTALCLGDSLYLAIDQTYINSHWNTGATTNDIWVNTPGAYTISASAEGCTVKDTINVAFNKLAELKIGNDTAICENHSLLLQSNISDAVYRWSDGSTKDTTRVFSPGGIVWLSIAKEGCTASDTLKIGILPLPTFTLGADTTVCTATNWPLSASSPDIVSYLWQDGSSKSSYFASSNGIYKVEVKDLNGCTNSDSISLSFLTVPVFSLGNDSVICTGENILLQPKTTYNNWLWQDGSQSPSFLVTQPGTYSLSVKNICGSTTDEIKINKGVCGIWMPNAFTPNNDGLNDIFRLKNYQFVKEFHMTVYNKQGGKIFETGDPSQGWDGKVNGKLQPPETYLWQITLKDKDGNDKSAYGTVVLIK